MATNAAAGRASSSGQKSWTKSEVAISATVQIGSSALLAARKSTTWGTTPASMNTVTPVTTQATTAG